MMNKTLRYILPILLLLLILGAVIFLVNSSKDAENKNSYDDKGVVNEISENRKLENNRMKLLSHKNPDIQNVIHLLNSGDLKNAIPKLEELIASAQLSPEEREALQTLLIYNYLAYGSAYYDESNYASQARELLRSSWVSHASWFYNYYMGYSYEIENNFTQALLYYEQAEKLASSSENIAKTLNQVGHVYDLQWDFDTAFLYYKRAYNKNPQDIQANINLGRAYTQKWDLETAREYFEKIVEGMKNKTIQSEIYFNLSTIAFYSNEDLDVSINFAQKTIDANPDYPLGDVGVARALLEKWEASLDVKENLDRSISLYSDLAVAHKYLWIYFYINEDFDNAIASFERQSESAWWDITLMWHQRQASIDEWKYFLVRSYAWNSDADNSMRVLMDLVDSWNIQYKVKFIEDMNIDNGPFEKIEKEDITLETLTNILLNYNK